MLSNLAFGLLPIGFSMLGMPVLLCSFRHRRENGAAGYFSLLCVSNVLWACCQALFYLLPGASAALLCYHLRLVFVCSSSILLFLMTLQVLKHRYLSKKMLAFLLVIPLTTGVVALTNADTGMLNQNAFLVYETGVKFVSARPGVWFWIHCVVCYSFLLCAAVLMIRQFHRLPRSYRTPLTIMLCGIFLTMFTSASAIFNLFPHGVDFTPFAGIVSQMFYYFAVFNPHTLDALISSRDIVFETADYPIFILSTDRRIIDANACAKHTAAGLGIHAMQGMPYDAFFAAWVSRYSYEVYKDDESIFTLHESGGDTHYQIVLHPLFSQRQKSLGVYVEMKNITPLMTLIHKLQDAAYFDGLTGLYSRNYFTRLCEELDGAAHLPLGILVGDVNGLKSTNDTYGHARGDELLGHIAQGLKTCSPEGAALARIGGDEFVALVPNTSDEAMRDFEKKLEAYCERFSGEGLPGVSIATAYTLRTDESQSIAALMHEADLNMYAAKRDRRRKS